MDEQQPSSWSYDNSVPPSSNNDFNHHRRYQNHYQDEPTNGIAFAGRKRHFSNEHSDAKLYVRGVPREVTEQDIHSLFGKYGNITEVVLFKELKNLQEQECCFVKYAKIEDATEAIRALHNQHIFPGGMRPIEVKYASKKHERPGCFWTQQCKVFVSFMNRHASKAEIAQVFSPYGCVEDVFLLRDEQKQNRGMGFISFSHKDMAVAAIKALNGKYVMEGCDQPLVVRFADPKKPKFGENRCGPYGSDPVGQSSAPNSCSYMFSESGTPSVGGEMGDGDGDDDDDGDGDCDWSEHICPDGNAYYYNCVTCESRWEKPEEYSFYEQQAV